MLHVSTIKPEQFQRNNFDGIRLLAATLVVYGHSYALMAPDGGEDVFKLAGLPAAHRIGLYMFFLISGFLVTRAIARRADYSYFVKSRLLRIVPGLLVSTLVTLCLIAPFSSWNYLNFSNWRDAGIYVIGNTSLLDATATVDSFKVFVNNPLPNAINGSLWSIALEVKLYVVLLLLYASGILTSRVSLRLAFYALIGWALFFEPAVLDLAPDSIHVVCAKYFWVGSLSYQLKSLVPTNYSILVVLTSLFALAGSDSAHWLSHVIIYFFVFAMAFRVPPIKLPGDYSYGIYLYAFPIQQVIAALFPDAGPLPAFALAMLLVLPFACFSWHMIEAKMLHLKDTAPLDPVWLAFVAIFLVFVVLDVYFLRSDMPVQKYVMVLSAIVLVLGSTIKGRRLQQVSQLG